MTTPGSPPTMALADLLIGLLERVPMSEAQIARATQAEPDDNRSVASRVGRLLRGSRLSGSLSSWRSSRRWRATFAATPSPSGSIATSTSSAARNPLDELAEGGYERMIQLALGLTHGVFT